jgi:hypothetical protein
LPPPPLATPDLRPLVIPPLLAPLVGTRPFTTVTSPGRGVSPQGALDLHGLHVDEATELLSAMLPDLADAGLKRAVLVTGSGHHSGRESRCDWWWLGLGSQSLRAC